MYWEKTPLLKFFSEIEIRLQVPYRPYKVRKNVHISLDTTTWTLIRKILNTVIDDSSSNTTQVFAIGSEGER